MNDFFQKKTLSEISKETAMILTAMFEYAEATQWKVPFFL